MSCFVPEDVKKKNPNFLKLVDRIETKMNEPSMSKLESKYWLAKSEWFETHVVYATVQSVLNDAQLKILRNDCTETETKAWNAVIRCFYVSQFPDCLRSKQNLPSHLLNNSSDYTEEDLNKGKKMLAEETEKKLEATAFKLIDARDGLEARENAKIRLARALQVGNILKDDKSTLFNNQMRLKQLQTDQANLNNVYNQALRDCSDLLIKLITKYCLHLQPLKDQAIVKNALVSCETLTAKLKSIRAELVLETYKPEALDALKKLRSEIISTIERREGELVDVEGQLEIYHRLGSEFEEIAKEYGQATSDLEKQQWTLREVKNKLNKT